MIARSLRHKNSAVAQQQTTEVWASRRRIWSPARGQIECSTKRIGVQDQKHSSRTRRERRADHGLERARVWLRKAQVLSEDSPGSL